MCAILCLVMAGVIASFLIRKVQDMTSFEKLTASVERLLAAKAADDAASKAAADAAAAKLADVESAVVALTEQVAKLKAEAGTPDADVDALAAKIDAVVPPPVDVAPSSEPATAA